MHGEEHHNTVMKVWNDERYLFTLACGYNQNYQIMCAILENKGSNIYLIAKKNGKYYGVMCCFMINIEGDGVISIHGAIEPGELILEQIEADKVLRGSRCIIPSNISFSKGIPRPTNVMKELMRVAQRCVKCM